MKIAYHIVQAGNRITYDQKEVAFVCPRLQEEQKDNSIRIGEWKKWIVKMLVIRHTVFVICY